jgi:hypothetical protein
MISFLVATAPSAGLGEDTQRPDQLFRRLDLSFGLKMLGEDFTSDRLPMDR